MGNKQSTNAVLSPITYESLEYINKENITNNISNNSNNSNDSINKLIDYDYNDDSKYTRRYTISYSDLYNNSMQPIVIQCNQRPTYDKLNHILNVQQTKPVIVIQL